ncbi:hypothetical protein AAG906_012157 [Vitis piasezkii]
MLQWTIELSEFGIEFQPRLSKRPMVDHKLTEPHAHQALELGSYYSPQLGNIWSKPSGWDSLHLTMKQNMKPSCPDWTSPLLYPSPNSESTKEYEAKDARMARYLAKVRNTLQQFTEWTIEKIKRADNGRADALAGIAASLPIKEAILLPIHVQASPSVAENPLATPLRQVKRMIKNGRMTSQNISGQVLYPEILNRRTKSGCKLPFTLIGGHLYKRSFTGPYLRCLGHSEAQYHIELIHKDTIGQQ